MWEIPIDIIYGSKCSRTTTMCSCRCIMYKCVNRVMGHFSQYLMNQHNLDPEPTIFFNNLLRVCCKDKVG